MKKYFIIVCLIFVGMVANAQFYLGGSIGLDVRNTQYSDANDVTNVKMNVLPEFGFYLSDRFDIGFETGFAADYSSVTEKTDITFYFVPYARYSFFSTGNFEVIGKMSIDNDFKDERTYLGLHLTPILAYNLTDHVTLQAGLNFLNFRTYYDKSGRSDVSNFGFGFGVDANNVATLGAIKVGFIYKF